MTLREVALCAIASWAGSGLPATAQTPSVFTGRVVDSDGAPAAGAIVVTSAGGESVVAADGSFELAVDLPPGAESVQVTAVGGAGGSSAVASARVTAPVAGDTGSAGVLTLAEGASCQPSWLPTFGWMPGVDRCVRAMAVFDDGSGPALYVGGEFRVAGGLETGGIARWDGEEWSSLGAGLGDLCALSVNALEVFDDGNGPRLYAAGSFDDASGIPVENIAKWDGTSWAPVGGGPTASICLRVVRSLAVFDDGGGAELYAGGWFRTAGGVVTSNIAKWNGVSWSPLGSGVDSNGVYAMAVFDDGSGPALFVGGQFTQAGPIAVENIARWDGVAWTQVGTGVSSRILALSVFDDGSGSALYAGGSFFAAGGAPANNVAKWDGTAWSAVGGGRPSPVASFLEFDDGSGRALYAGTGSGGGGGPTSGLAKWDGAAWVPLVDLDGAAVLALAAFDDGDGLALWAGGGFVAAGGRPARGIAKWDGTDWSSLGDGSDDEVYALRAFDDGSGEGPALYVGGRFTSIGGVPLNHVAKWDGTTWAPLGAGTTTPVTDFEVFDDGSGPALYAGGIYTIPQGAVWRWDGSSWSPLGTGVNDSVNCLRVFDDGIGSGPALYVAGSFTTAGGLSSRSIARWDGASWSSVNNNVTGSSHVNALEVFDDGSGGGPQLYVGGQFVSLGGVSTRNVARWDGTSWSSVGGGTDRFVSAFTVYDEGGGPRLFAAGGFTSAGGFPTRHIARWDGVIWSRLDAGLDYWTLELTVFDDGSGPALYAGGLFNSAGSGIARSIARWDGASWSPLGGGMNGAVVVLEGYDDGLGGGPALYAGGVFDVAYDSNDSFLARWGCPSPTTPVTYCTAKSTSAGCVPYLSSSGVPSVSSGPLFLESHDHVPGQAGIYVYGFKKANQSFHGGKLCVKLPAERLLTLVKATDGIACTSCAGTCRTFRRNFNALIQSGVDPMLTAGQRVNVQVRQRDPANLGPTGFPDNLSDGISFVIGP